MSCPRMVLAALFPFVLGGCGAPSPAVAKRVSSLTNYPAWNKFVSRKGRFSVEVPGFPKLKSSIVKAKKVRIPAESFIVNAKQGSDVSSYGMYYADYPAGHVQKFEPYDFLERTWKKRYADLEKNLVYEKRIKLGTFPGIEFQYKDQGRSKFTATTRYYLVNNRSYLVTAMTSKVGLRRGYAGRYLESFRLLK